MSEGPGRPADDDAAATRVYDPARAQAAEPASLPPPPIVLPRAATPPAGAPRAATPPAGAPIVLPRVATPPAGAPVAAPFTLAPGAKSGPHRRPAPATLPAPAGAPPPIAASPGAAQPARAEPTEPFETATEVSPRPRAPIELATPTEIDPAPSAPIAVPGAPSGPVAVRGAEPSEPIRVFSMKDQGTQARPAKPQAAPLHVQLRAMAEVAGRRDAPEQLGRLAPPLDPRAPDRARARRARGNLVLILAGVALAAAIALAIWLIAGR